MVVRKPAANVQKRRKKAGHRSWAPRGGIVPGANRGDTMSAATRSAVMSRIRGKDTGPERFVAEYLSLAGLTFEQHVRELPGRPDIVLRDVRIAVFVDGDFWHGWRFPLWKTKLTERWQEKIEATRRRDQRNFRRLRQLGWHVIRIWEHQIEQDIGRAVKRIHIALRVREGRLRGFQK
jgi:DNA mismatch endonuclease (patch repair protein)